MPVEDLSAAPPWHRLTPTEAARRLEADGDRGLDEAEAAIRLARFGANRLKPAAGRTLAARVAGQFRDVLVLVLVAAAAVSLAIGEGLDAGVILAVVVANAAIGLVQEGRAERALAAIGQMLSAEARVVREGRERIVPAETLVPGDLVAVEAGDRIPADLRLVETVRFSTEEAALTGESAPVAKAIDPAADGAIVSDRHSMAHAGTFAVTGRARGLVVATGSATEIGRISRMIETVEALDTPLFRKLLVFGRWLTAIVLAATALLFLVGWLGGTMPPAEMFMAAVGLAVAAIPEGLPAIVTVGLAIGVERMAARGAIIRRMPAIEALGAVTVIATDKTGTLTVNEMTTERIVTASDRIAIGGIGYAPVGELTAEHGDSDSQEVAALIRAAALCNDASLDESGGRYAALGDPVDAALITLALKSGLDPEALRRDHRREDQVPFDPAARIMIVALREPSGMRRVIVKGAPERLLALADRERVGGAVRPIRREAWFDALDDMAAKGLRILALAERIDGGSEPGETDLGLDRGGFVFLGLAGMRDPERAESAASVAAARRAGIRVVMITGDHAATARAVALRVGLPADATVIEGTALDGLAREDFARAAAGADVVARATPEVKLRLVEALQAQGEVVAMTGDGVNDAPALKRADVGVAMGAKGTEVARQAAAMVITDDDFSTIVGAVRAGRVVTDNLVKSILYILPTNGAEAIGLIAAVLVGFDLPMTALQLLWINLVTESLLSLSLAFDPAEPDVMRRPPRDPKAPLVTPLLLWRILFVSALMGAASTGLFLWERALGADLAVARTVAVNALVAAEIAYLFNARHPAASSLNAEAFLGNRLALLGAAVLIGIQVAFTTWPPLQTLFGTAALDGRQVLTIAAVAVAVFFVAEAEKAVLRRLVPFGG